MWPDKRAAATSGRMSDSVHRSVTRIKRLRSGFVAKRKEQKLMKERRGMWVFSVSKIVALTLVLLACVCVPALAATWYVDGTNGANTNGGTSWSDAWKTIDYGDSAFYVNDGDTVEVAAGTYVVPAGTPGGLTIHYAGATYHANGRVVIDGQFACDQLFTITAITAPVTIDGFEFTGARLYGVFGGDWGGSVADNTTIKNCRFHDMGSATGDCACIWVRRSNGWVIRNNAFYNVVSTYYESTAIRLYDSYPSLSPYSATVVNNTFDNCLHSFVNATYNQHPTLKNNIIINSQGWAYLCYDDGSFFSGSPFWTVDYNMRLNCPGGLYNAPAGTNDITTGDAPAFVNASIGNYHLVAGSTGINAGVDVGYGPYVGAPDLGAYEYDSASAAVAISGKVTDPSNNPISGVAVATVGENGGGGSATTDSAGHYSISLTYPGLHKLEASKTGLVTVDATLLTVSGGSYTQNFTTTGPGTVSGYVVDSSTTLGISGATVTLVGTSTTATTDGTGFYHMSVPSGSCTFSVTRVTYVSPPNQTVTVPSGGSKTVSFAMDPYVGKTYYVDPVNGGNDVYDGLSATVPDPNPTSTGPWATIDRGDVLGILKPRDTVSVAPGTYDGWSGRTYGAAAAIVSCAGVATAPITYKASGPGVVINGADQPWNPNQSNGFTVGALAPYTVIDGFEITNKNYGFVIDGSHVTVKNCIIHDIYYDTGGNYPSAGIMLGWNAAPGNTTITNNLIYNILDYSTPKGDTPWYGKSRAVWAGFQSPISTTFNNNTVVNSDHVFDDGWNNFLTLDVHNNIFANLRAQAFYLRQWTSMNQLNNTYNLYWNNVGGDYAGNYPPSRGFGEFDADPLLNSAYQPSSGSSPAVNTGVNVGLPYLGPAPDRGYFETSFTDVNGLLSGTVVDATTGTGIAGATVTVGSTVVSADSGGGYLVAPLAGGTYTVSASATGYTGASGSVKVSGVTAKVIALMPATGVVTVANVANLGAISTYPQAVNVTLPLVVTTTYPGNVYGGFHVESADRAFGVRCRIPAAGFAAVNEGDRITFAGTVNKDGNGEVCFYPATLTSQTAGAKLGALGMSNKAANGSHQVGLLAEIWGTVTYNDGTVMYVDDGSGVDDGLGVAKGIRIPLNGITTAPSSGMVTVTGPVVQLMTGTTVSYRVFPRTAADIY